MTKIASFGGPPLSPYRRAQEYTTPRTVVADAVDQLNFGVVIRPFMIPLMIAYWLALLTPPVMGSHGGHEGHSVEEHNQTMGPGYAIPGASFKVFFDKESRSHEAKELSEDQIGAAIQTVVQALSSMTRDQSHYPRFDEAITKDVLHQVVIETRVFNREGKEFPFLVVRTKHQGKVKLLISASALEEGGYLNHPDKLIPVLAREFQWVVVKSDTSPKRPLAPVGRDLKGAPIKPNKEILEMPAGEREEVLRELFHTYLTTVDDYKSLDGQPGYEVGSTTLISPAHPGAATELYDARIREALQLIVRDPYFQEHTPQAVVNLLNGKIWNVSYVKIDERDWATRTRVLPKEKAVAVGIHAKTIQPANILVNIHRTAAPEDPFYAIVAGLPMGALSTDQLARVIALEIQNNIIEKSMRGHVAQDEVTAPSE